MTTIRNPNPVYTSGFPTSSQGLQPYFDPAADRAQFDQACRQLAQNFGKFDGWFDDGTMDMNELYAAARGEKGPEVQQAAQFILSRPNYLAELDTAKEGGNQDGKVSLGDLTSQIGKLDREQQLQSLRFDPRLPEFQRSVQSLILNREALDAAGDMFGGQDGKISRNDLYAVLNGGQYSPELKDAAAFFLRHQDLLGVLDTAAKGGGQDGIVSYEDLQALNSQLSNVRSALPPPMIRPGGYYGY